MYYTCTSNQRIWFQKISIFPTRQITVLVEEREGGGGGGSEANRNYVPELDSQKGWGIPKKILLEWAWILFGTK